MAGAIAMECLDQIFLQARTHNKWQDKPVPEELLRQIADTMKIGPTSANQSPARIVFVQTPEGKKRLEPHLSEGNRAKTMAAPVCAIIGYDIKFYEHLPKLFPHADAKPGSRASRTSYRDLRLPQRHATGRLPHRSGSRSRPRHRADVGL